MGKWKTLCSILKFLCRIVSTCYHVTEKLARETYFVKLIFILTTFPSSETFLLFSLLISFLHILLQLCLYRNSGSGGYQHLYNQYQITRIYVRETAFISFITRGVTRCHSVIFINVGCRTARVFVRTRLNHFELSRAILKCDRIHGFVPISTLAASADEVVM